MQKHSYNTLPVTKPHDISPIAIVGMAGIYPHAKTLDELWNIIANGYSSFSLPKKKWGNSGCYIPNASSDKESSWIGRFIEDVEINVEKFGIPPIHAIAIARLQLLTLEAIDMCIEDAGYTHHNFKKDMVDIICGCCLGFDRTFANALRVESAKFVSVFVNQLCSIQPNLPPEEAVMIARDLRSRFRSRFGGTSHDRIGEMASTIPARISIGLKTHGRCFALESTDATSFVALQVAARNLRSGECDMAIVTAGQLFESPLAQVAMSKKGMLSLTEPVPFKRNQTGFMLGEGVGVLLLKRLDDAVQDGNKIYSIITGIGINHTSQQGTLRYSSSIKDRRNVVIAACEESGCRTSSIQYIECFASGLPVESELEIESLASSIANEDNKSIDRREVFIGSVKEQLGHTFANAGLASVMKVALSLHKKLLPPQHKINENDLIDLSDTPFVINRKLKSWPENLNNEPRRAGINGCSLSGTNCHIILEEFDNTKSVTYNIRKSEVRTQIAIVGFGGYFAAASNAEQFWVNISTKHDTLRPLPQTSFDRSIYFNPLALDIFKSYSEIGSKIIEPSIPVESRIIPRRQIYMDIAQKLGFVVAQEAFSRYGYPSRSLPDKKTAVIIATNLCLDKERTTNNGLQYPELEKELFELSQFSELNPDDKHQILQRLREQVRNANPVVTNLSFDGYIASGIAANISNEFSLNAVPIAVEAACASSLAAFDMSVNGLMTREYDFVVAGGVELPTNTRDLVMCSNLGLLSKNRITPFDAKADGFSVGDGIALFLLKRLEDAIANNDQIYGVIRGIGSSCDAKSLIAPDEEGQTLAMKRAFSKVDFKSEDVQYIETHGTGTEIGDPVEVRSIASVYGNSKRATPVVLGSIKSMIGHTFAAAGAAGLLKTVLAIHYKLLPPNIALEKLNPKLDLESIPAYVNTETTPWLVLNDQPRRAAVSSFGTGGINYHLLLEEYIHRSN
jgi:beta-ketoacyl ACP synthase